MPSSVRNDKVASKKDGKKKRPEGSEKQQGPAEDIRLQSTTKKKKKKKDKGAKGAKGEQEIVEEDTNQSENMKGKQKAIHAEPMPMPVHSSPYQPPSQRQLVDAIDGRTSRTKRPREESVGDGYDPESSSRSKRHQMLSAESPQKNEVFDASHTNGKTRDLSTARTSNNHRGALDLVNHLKKEVSKLEKALAAKDAEIPALRAELGELKQCYKNEHRNQKHWTKEKIEHVKQRNDKKTAKRIAIAFEEQIKKGEEEHRRLKEQMSGELRGEMKDEISTQTAAVAKELKTFFQETTEGAKEEFMRDSRENIERIRRELAMEGFLILQNLNQFFNNTLTAHRLEIMPYINHFFSEIAKLDILVVENQERVKSLQATCNTLESNQHGTQRRMDNNDSQIKNAFGALNKRQKELEKAHMSFVSQSQLEETRKQLQQNLDSIGQSLHPTLASTSSNHVEQGNLPSGTTYLPSQPPDLAMVQGQWETQSVKGNMSPTPHPAQMNPNDRVISQYSSLPQGQCVSDSSSLNGHV